MRRAAAPATAVTGACSRFANTSESQASWSVAIGYRAPRHVGGRAVEILPLPPASRSVEILAGGPTVLIDLLHQVIRYAHLFDLVELSFDPVDMIFLVLQYGIHEFP